VPIFLSGIGTVQAYNSVAVRSRVDGAITQVLFTEGQDVHVGDPLLTIDPRPFQALLAQAQAMRVKDQATLDGQGNRISKQGQQLGQVAFIPCGSHELYTC
jgi:multidrug efflux system membrane fusion protein